MLIYSYVLFDVAFSWDNQFTDKDIGHHWQSKNDIGTMTIDNNDTKTMAMTSFNHNEIVLRRKHLLTFQLNLC